MALPTKNCKLVLKSLRSKGNDKIRFDVNDIAELCGLSFVDARRAAQYLFDEGFFADATEPQSYFGGRPGFEVYELTEKGKHPMAFQTYQTKKFLKSQIIAILALIVAIISLLHQICN